MIFEHVGTREELQAAGYDVLNRALPGEPGAPKHRLTFHDSDGRVWLTRRAGGRWHACRPGYFQRLGAALVPHGDLELFELHHARLDSSFQRTLRSIVSSTGRSA